MTAIERERSYICEDCGTSLVRSGRGRPRRFCLVCSPADPLGATTAWRARHPEYTEAYNASRRIPRDQWKKSSRVFVAHEVSCSGGCGSTVTTRGPSGRCAECKAITVRERNRRKNNKRRSRLPATRCAKAPRATLSTRDTKGEISDRH
jgi:hypothetical protein